MQGGPLDFISLKMPACDFDVETSLTESRWRSKKVVKFSSSVDKESTCNAGDLGSIPGSERTLEEGMATTPVFWPGGLQSMGLQRVRHD